MLVLKLYKAENSDYFIKTAAIFGIALIGIYMLYPEINAKVFVAAIIVFVSYFAFRTKKRQSIGKISLEDHTITIITDIKETQFELAEIDDLEIVYSGYKGKKIVGDIIPRFNKFSGIDNYIKIVSDNRKYAYNLQFENLAQENEMMDLAKKWCENGYDTSKIRLNR